MKRRKIGWMAAGLLATLLLLAAAAWHFLQSRQMATWQLLAHVVQLEAAGVDEQSVQQLGWSLAILGRDDEVRTMDFHPQFEEPPSTVDVERLELNIVPWKEGLERIAAEHRIVMIMEDHFVSKHREFIGVALPVFRDAGYTHYAAEAIGPADTSLAERGYPMSATGLYTSDPRFGNALRRALELEFEVLGYDFVFSTHDEREESAAARLAQVIRDDGNRKLLIHAGHAHVLKYHTGSAQGGRWLAARLWEKTGVEPFTIWQWSRMHGARDYEQIVSALEASEVRLDEPVLLMPPPAADVGFQDSPYGLAPVDAIVIHPPDASVAPAERTILFPEAMRKLAGRWTGERWPVVIAACRGGEPLDATPLDQVMLRQGEREFVLWIPAEADYEIRVFDVEGAVDSLIEWDAGRVLVGVRL